MDDSGRFLRIWVGFAGTVLAVAVLYWAQPVIVPVLLAGLLTFVLSPVVSVLQRAVGRVVAVLLVAVLAFSAIALAGWAVAREVNGVVRELPSYRQNIRQKIRDIREAGKGGSVESLQKTVQEIQDEMGKGGPPGTTAAPLIVESSQSAGLWGLPTAVGPYLEPVATGGLVVVLVIFMLFEREELRNRLIKLMGLGRLAVTTRAIDEAGRRVSRYLLFQSLVNAAFGVGVGIGLYLIGLPYVLLWACLAAALRFIPYIGPWVGATGPILVSLAVFDGWTEPIEVVLLFAMLELGTNLILEPFFYAGAAGISQVGLLVSLAFWTWLWGPLGLLMATPLTVCLVVMGKHVPGLEFLSTAMSDDPLLEEDATFYQRLLANDQSEAEDILERAIERDGVLVAYDSLIVRALNYAERDRLEGRLSPQEEASLLRTAEDLLAEVEADASAAKEVETAQQPIQILGYPVEGEADIVALRMLKRLLPPPLELEIAPPNLMASDVIAMRQTGKYRALCIADLPPSNPSRSRYLVKRIRMSMPEVRVLVCRWGPPGFTDEGEELLLRSGAHQVAVSLQETYDELVRLAPATEGVASVAREDLSPRPVEPSSPEPHPPGPFGRPRVARADT